MALPYSQAKAAPENSLQQIQKILGEFGCAQFGTMWDLEHSEIIIQFKWKERRVELRACWLAYAKKLAGQSYHGSLKNSHLKQAKISVCSALRDWVKGQVTIVECGVMSFEEIFMPQLLLPQGGRLIDKAIQLYLPKESS